jgi:seryl-tRNA synthetase
MDRTANKIIEALKLVDESNPELALSALRMASRLAGGSLATWLESLVKANGKGVADSRLEGEVGTLKEEINWLGHMLQLRNEEIRKLKKEIAILKKEDGASFDDTEPEKLELARVKAELQDAKQALNLLTRFLDDFFKGLPGKENFPVPGEPRQDRSL